MRLTLLLALALFASPLFAQVVTYEPGQEPPAGTFQPPAPREPGPPQIPLIDMNLDPVGNAPFFQPAHNGRYTYGNGTGEVIIYQHLPNGAAIVTVLLMDGRWADAFGSVANRSQVLLDLYVGEDLVGEIKLGTVATTGSPAPKSGTPCGRLFARARLNTELVFPDDPNLNCSLGPGNPGQFCLAQQFTEKVGSIGPETCDLSR